MLPFDDTTSVKVEPGDPRSSGMLRDSRTQAIWTTTYCVFMDVISTVLMRDPGIRPVGPLDEVDVTIKRSEL